MGVNPNNIHLNTVNSPNVAKISEPFTTGSDLKISQAARSRALKVKTKLELQYEIIARIQGNFFPDDFEVREEDNENDEERHNEHGFKNNVYNPLQTIRNRADRKRLPGGTNTLQPGNNELFTKDFMWKVDNAELVQDYGWRSRNYLLMRDQRGRLLYHHSNNVFRSGTSNPKGLGDELIQRLRSKLRNSLNDGSETSSLSASDAEDHQTPEEVAMILNTRKSGQCLVVVHPERVCLTKIKVTQSFLHLLHCYRLQEQT